MGREISMFSDYRQGENSLTNYCGLIMKLLYEDSPKQFEELLAALLGTDQNILVGPSFSQQTKSSNSIPDLVITQKSFSIFFETKTTDWFYDDQLKRHMEGFNNNVGTKILFLLSNFENGDLEERFKNQIEVGKLNNVVVQPLTFEDFIGALEGVSKSEYLNNLLEEFKVYLDRNGHLPKWKYLLDVVSCSGTMNEIREGIYMCPDTGGPYRHRRAKYFGPYANKRVLQIFEIKAVVVIEKDLGEGKVKWKDTDDNNRKLIEEAKEKLQMWKWRIEENNSVPTQVFLLHKCEQTNFLKVSSGGMMQSKKYFWDIATDCKNSKQLADKLRDKTWE